MQDQSQWDMYQENHEIEQIGYSSRKISDKTQVRDKQTFGVSIGQVYWRVEWSDGHSDYNQMMFWHEGTGDPDDPIITPDIETFGDTDFKITDGDIRMPLYGGYKLSGNIDGGTSSTPVGFDFRINNRSVKKFETTSPYSVPFDFIVNVGKYDVLTVRARINDSPYSQISGNVHIQLNITKL